MLRLRRIEHDRVTDRSGLAVQQIAQDLQVGGCIATLQSFDSSDFKPQGFRIQTSRRRLTDHFNLIVVVLSQHS